MRKLSVDSWPSTQPAEVTVDAVIERAMKNLPAMGLGASVRRAGKNLVHRAGLFSALQRPGSGGTAVLFYHKVHDSPSGLWGEPVLNPIEFDRQLAYLTRHFEPVRLSDLVAAVRSRGRVPFPKKTFCVTFDDGYQNNLLVAAPILRKHRIPTTLFVTTGLIGTDQWMWGYEVERMLYRYGQRHFGSLSGDPVLRSLCERGLPNAIAMMACVEYLKIIGDLTRRPILQALRRRLPVAVDDENRFLDWEELRELRLYDFEIGAHTLSHPILPTLPPEEAEREILESRDTLEKKLGTRPTLFSYPNGDHDDAVRAVVARHFEAAVGVQAGLCVPGSPLYALPRLCAPATAAELAADLNRMMSEHKRVAVPYPDTEGPADGPGSDDSDAGLQNAAG